MNYKNYLKNAINLWYYNAKIDYGVNGKFISAEICGDTIVVFWEEEGKKFKSSYRWFTDYSPEDIYNMWMCEDEENIYEVA